MNAEGTVPTMPAAVGEVQAAAPVVCAMPQRKGGFQKKVDKLTRRVHMLEQLVETLDSKVALQEAIIRKLLREREGKKHV